MARRAIGSSRARARARARARSAALELDQAIAATCWARRALQSLRTLWQAHTRAHSPLARFRPLMRPPSPADHTSSGRSIRACARSPQRRTNVTNIVPIFKEGVIK